MQNFDLYIRLIWLLTAIIIFLIFFLSYLYISMTKAQKKESLSIEFSNMMIEGIENERKRIARELHDIVLPQLAGHAVQDTIRGICIDIMPPDFTRLSLNEALADICTKFSQKSGIECVLSINKEVDFSMISAEHQLHLYRMVQEALTNIEKHSQAKNAVLIARNDRNKILICISDDGLGLGLEHIAAEKEFPNEGLGMRSMRQRAALINAKLDFISESGNGLMVRIELPPPQCEISDNE